MLTQDTPKVKEALALSNKTAGKESGGGGDAPTDFMKMRTKKELIAFAAAQELVIDPALNKDMAIAEMKTAITEAVEAKAAGQDDDEDENPLG